MVRGLSPLGRGCLLKNLTSAFASVMEGLCGRVMTAVRAAVKKMSFGILVGVPERKAMESCWRRRSCGLLDRRGCSSDDMCCLQGLQASGGLSSEAMFSLHRRYAGA